jgi:hypothetical protein
MLDGSSRHRGPFSMDGVDGAADAAQGRCASKSEERSGRRLQRELCLEELAEERCVSRALTRLSMWWSSKR